MFHFIPKSSATTCGAGAVLVGMGLGPEPPTKPGSHETAPPAMTSRVRSRPTRPGLAWALATRRASSRSVVETIPFSAPRDRVRRTRARVSIALDPDHAVLGEVVVERPARPVVAGDPAQLADDEGPDPGAGALGVLGVDAVVADHRVGHRHDLAVIRRVGQDLLIPGHAGVEDDLAVDLAPGAERAAGEHRPVFQGKLGNIHDDRVNPLRSPMAPNAGPAPVPASAPPVYPPGTSRDQPNRPPDSAPGPPGRDLASFRHREIGFVPPGRG